MGTNKGLRQWVRDTTEGALSYPIAFSVGLILGALGCQVVTAMLYVTHVMH